MQHESDGFFTLPSYRDDDDAEHGGRSLAEQSAHERRLMSAPRSILLPTGTRYHGNPFLKAKRPIDLSAPYPSFDFVIRDLGMAVGPPTILVAMGYSGKSLLAQHMALCVATGSLFLGTHPVKKGTVLHLDYDQGTEQTVVRYQRLAHGLGLSKNAISQGIDLVRPEMKLDQPKAEDELRDAVDGYSLCIIDALRPAIGADENDSRVREPVTMLGRISEKTGCAFLLIHHTGKNDSGDPRMVARGSSAIFDAAGTVLFLKSQQAPNGFVYQLIQTKSRTGRFAGALNYRLEDVGDVVETINETQGVRLVPEGRVSKEESLDRLILGTLEEGEISATDLRKKVGKRKEDVGESLNRLVGKSVTKRTEGRNTYYRLSESHEAGWEDSGEDGDVAVMNS